MSDTSISDHVETHPVRYALACGVALAPLVVNILPVFGIWQGLPLDIFLLAYYVDAFWPLSVKKRGAIDAFDTPGVEVGPGWHFAPRGLTKRHWYPVDEQEVQFPGDPEKIQREDDKIPLRDGFVRPMRFISAKSKGSDDPLDTRLALEVTFSLRWRLMEHRFYDLHVHIPGDTWEEKVVQIEKAMRDTAEGLLQEIIAQLTPDEFNAQLTAIGKRLQAAIQEAVDDWGIRISNLKIQSPNTSHTLNIALSDIGVSKAEAASQRNRAAGQRDADIEIGKGLGKRREEELAGEGRGQKAAADAIGISGREYFAGSVARDALKDGTKYVLGPENITGVFGLGLAALDSLKEKEGDKKS